MFISFWRGEVPPKQAFWYWGVAAWIAIAVLEVIVPHGLLAGAMRVVVPIYLVFSAVGIFRSAKRYSGNNAFRIVGLIVPVAYVLFWFLLAGWAIILLAINWLVAIRFRELRFRDCPHYPQKPSFYTNEKDAR